MNTDEHRLSPYNKIGDRQRHSVRAVVIGFTARIQVKRKNNPLSFICAHLCPSVASPTN
jgi:hypothetical protein